MNRVPVNPVLLRWARERSQIAPEKLVTRFRKLPEWERGETKPTQKQAEDFARAVLIPVGYLFLSEPPEEPMPIPDFRTMEGRAVRRPSPSLLDTIYTCQRRQDWYRDFVQSDHEPELGFVGSATLGTSPETVAADMRKKLSLENDPDQLPKNWTEALQFLIRQADVAGILVMVSGIVRNNTRRPLDPEEFRGFALADPLAPLIFINGADTKAAQMFTFAHELAHLWLGTSALSETEFAPRRAVHRDEEVWCNAVAAEFLVPMTRLRAELQREEPLPEALSRLARIFKVSSLVILRRLLDARQLERPAFERAWEEERRRLVDLSQKSSGGGDYYRTTLARTSQRFVQAVLASTIEGQTLYRDAFRLLNISSIEIFNKLGREVGVIR